MPHKMGPRNKALSGTTNTTKHTQFSILQRAPKIYKFSLLLPPPPPSSEKWINAPVPELTTINVCKWIQQYKSYLKKLVKKWLITRLWENNRNGWSWCHFSQEKFPHTLIPVIASKCCGSIPFRFPGPPCRRPYCTHNDIPWKQYAWFDACFPALRSIMFSRPPPPHTTHTDMYTH